MSAPGTPSQTVGPYLSIGLTWEEGPHVVAPDAPGAVWLRGEVRDGDGQAPHIDVSVFARGMLNRCVTRIYFADADNASDPVLESVPEARRPTLLAEPGADGYRFDVRPGRA